MGRSLFTRPHYADMSANALDTKAPDRVYKVGLSIDIVKRLNTKTALRRSVKAVLKPRKQQGMTRPVRTTDPACRKTNNGSSLPDG